MIYTITLNPAIDKMVLVDDFGVDKVNRVTKVQQDPGGKGINVSKMVHNLEGSSIAVMIAGGHAGGLLKEMLDEIGIQAKVFECDGETRTNIKVCDIKNGTFTDINEPGPQVDVRLMKVLDDYLNQVLEAGDIVSLSGSLPKGVPDDIYQRWSNIARIKGAKVILDADGEILKKGIKGKPFMIKPNKEELERCFDLHFNKDEHIVYYARRIIEMGVSYVVVSQGEDGCLLISKEHNAKIRPLRVQVKSTVGAGDSMVAAIANCLDKSEEKGEPDFDRMYKYVTYGVAASSASIEQDGSIMGTMDRINELYDRLTAVR